VHERDPLLELLVVSTTEACEIPIEASRVSDLTMRGRPGAWGVAPRAARDDDEVGHRDPVVREELLGDRLVAGQQQPPRVTAAIGGLEQLEVGHDVLVPDRHVVEALEQVEGDVGLELGDGVADHSQVAADAQGPHLVPEAAQRRDHVVLHLPVGRLEFCLLGLLGRHEALCMRART
jgi:hypothetical protein